MLRKARPATEVDRIGVEQPMAAPTLAETLTQYGRAAYLLTIANDGPHTSFVSVDLKGNVIACAIGKSAARNIATEPNVSLFWPPGSRAAMLSSSMAQPPDGARRAAGPERRSHGPNQSFIALDRSLPTATGRASQTAGASRGRHNHAGGRSAQY
jgi:hypothetical protein